MATTTHENVTTHQHTRDNDTREHGIETRHASKTTELIAYVAAVVATATLWNVWGWGSGLLAAGYGEGGRRIQTESLVGKALRRHFLITRAGGVAAPLPAWLHADTPTQVFAGRARRCSATVAPASQVSPATT